MWPSLFQEGDFEVYGTERARTYCHDLVASSALRLAARWGTKTLGLPEQITSMANIILPSIPGLPADEPLSGAKLSHWLRKEKERPSLHHHD